MITAICEITARIVAKCAPSRVHEVVVACPIFDDKQIRAYRNNYWQLVSFVDGIKDKVTVLLQGWLPTCNISVSARELEYPSTITCGDSHQEIVRDIISTLINQLV